MYHFIGIKGSGMSALAQIMKKLGYEVQGSDVEKHFFTQIELDKLGVKILPFNKDNIKENLTIVRGTTFNENNNEEVKKAKELNLKIYDYPEMLGELTKKFETIAICGTHGKTTTTGILSHVLNNSIGCNYLIGDGTGFIDKKSNNFVIESCEFERHFLNYTPSYAIVTNIELDHVDCYKNVDEIIEVFNEFINKAKNGVIACGDDLNVRKLKAPNITYYGFNDDNDVIAKNLVQRSDGTSFDCYIKGEFYGHFDIKLYGKHMILDSLACIYMSYLLGVSKEDILYYLDTFKGAKRRFDEEVVLDSILVDDYAHHPTEIKTVIETARQKYPEKTVVAVLIPYTLSRAKAFYKEFADVIKLADKAFVTEIEPAREKLEDYPGITSKMILELTPGAEMISAETIDKLYDYKNSVILFMGCKDSSYLRDAYKKGKLK